MRALRSGRDRAMSRPPSDLATERPTGQRITAGIDAADPLGYMAAELAAAEWKIWEFYRLELSYKTQPLTRALVDADDPELGRSIRNGRLEAGLLERCAYWRGRLGR